ncbi:LysE family translocator [Dongshaea marina]|uniref:LysE family translocator n=1 Tax=Dongshaea marina TaxID=2047966 RepID=UPI000D3EB820|nr:LysE family translocator [Dongshaea marina]
MIDFSILPIYLTAIIALLMIPGPDLLLIISSSISYGRRVGFFTCLGICSAGFSMTLLAALGISALVVMSPLALNAIKVIGGLYLLKLSWDSFKSRVDTKISTLELPRHQLTNSLYRRAFLTSLLNPKALIFFVLFLPQFVSNHATGSTGIQILILGLILNFSGFSFYSLVVAMAGTLGKRLLNSHKFHLYQHRFMGLIFLLLAIWLLSSNLQIHHISG